VLSTETSGKARCNHIHIGLDLGHDLGPIFDLYLEFDLDPKFDLDSKFDLGPKFDLDPKFDPKFDLG